MDFPVKNVLTKRMVSIKTVAEIIDVPVDVIKWNIEKFAEEEGIAANNDYCFSWKQYWVSLPALLWLVNKVQYKDYAVISNMVEELMKVETPEPDNTAAQTLADSVAKLVEVQEALKLSQETVSDLMSGIKSGIKKADKIEKKEKPTNRRNSAFLPALTVEQEEWYRKLSAVADMKSKETGIMSSKLFSMAYGVMRSNYGVVFEQTKKDYLYENNLPQETEITTLRLIIYHDDLRSILWGIMGNIEEYIEDKKKVS